MMLRQFEEAAALVSKQQPHRFKAFGGAVRGLTAQAQTAQAEAPAAAAPSTPSTSQTARAPQRHAGPSQNRSPFDSLPRQLLDDIMAASLKRQTGVSLRYILDFANMPTDRRMLFSARFMHNELPIRLAHRIMDLNHLPPALSNNIHVQRVKTWYAASFSEMRKFPGVKDQADVVAFTELLKAAYSRHGPVVPAIAKGVEEYKRSMMMAMVGGQGIPATLGADLNADSLKQFLDTFFLSRIGLRFLAGNHIAMHEQARRAARSGDTSGAPPAPQAAAASNESSASSVSSVSSPSEPSERPASHPSDWVGLIHTRCSPVHVVQDAVEAARAICIREKGDCPEVIVLGNPGSTFPYVPSHLHHMVFELVKNSLRAVHERYESSDSAPPPITVVVASGSEDVTIKVSDQGGGIPRSGLPRIWTYLYTTAKSPLPELDPSDDNYQALPAVLAGYGCGLPLSRLYARYFQGDMQIFSMDGYGTDAYLHLMRLGNTEEPLPSSFNPCSGTTSSSTSWFSSSTRATR